MGLEAFERRLQRRERLMVVEIIIVKLGLTHVVLFEMVDFQHLQLGVRQIFERQLEHVVMDRFGAQLGLLLHGDGHVEVMVDHRHHIFRQLDVEFDHVSSVGGCERQRGDRVLANGGTAATKIIKLEFAEIVKC